MKKFVLATIMVMLLTAHCSGDKGGINSKVTDHGTEHGKTSRVSSKQKPSKEFKISSILFELTVAADREKFATEQSIFISDGKVKVFLFLRSDSSSLEREKMLERYNMVIEKRSNDVLRAMVPIDELLSLSKEPLVWSIDLPDKPVTP